MNAIDLQTVKTQLNQVATDSGIVLTQILKIPLDRKDEIGALREAVRALMNAIDMLNGVCSTLVRQSN